MGGYDCVLRIVSLFHVLCRAFHHILRFLNPDDVLEILQKTPPRRAPLPRLARANKDQVPQEPVEEPITNDEFHTTVALFDQVVTT